MKRIITLLAVLATAITTQARCDWSGYWMKKVNQQQNVFTFQTNVKWDNCIDYWWIVYDHQLKRSDTVQDIRGFSQIQFNAKGKYTVKLKVVDDCNKCDTTFQYLVDITIYGKATVDWRIGVHNCRSYSFEMTEFDTCVEYYYSIYKSQYFDTMSDQTWKDLTDSAIYFGYDFDEKDLVFYNMTSQRKIYHDFADSGRHFMSVYWYNRCTGIDTWAMRKIEVCPRGNSLGTHRLSSSEPKLMGIYDMLGRRVYAVRKNEVLIYIYNDGSRKKIVQE